MRVLVLGGGVSGRAAIDLLTRDGHEVVVFDERMSTVESLRSTGLDVAHTWSVDVLDTVDLVVTSPGFSPSEPPVSDVIASGLALWSEIELAARRLDVPMAAVTGTNGKTTVTELVSDMLTASGVTAPAVGNIGTPLAEIVDDDLDAAVVEVSSFQLFYSASFHPTAAVLLNVAPDHLDWHGSYEAYADAKARIFANQTEEDLLVYVADDRGAADLAERAPSRRVPISASWIPPGGFGVRDDELVLPGGSVPISALRVSDDAYLTNLAAAAVAADHLGATHEAIVDVARSFMPSRHRRTLVGEWDGVRWIDDSKATNPHAALAAIRAYQSVVLIAGGRNKGLDLTRIPGAPNLRFLIAIGESADELLAVPGPPGRKAGSMQDAIRLADSVAVPGDTVLLAPGCASFDMFSSYGERGDVFAAQVHALKESA